MSGVLDAQCINNIDDVLYAVDKLGDYTLIPKVTTDAELGLYIVDAGILEMPEEAKPYLDYTGIGKKYYANLGGVYTNEGYVVRSDALNRNEGHRFTAVSLAVTANEKLVRLALPAEDNELENAMSDLGVASFDYAKISQIEIHDPYLVNYLPMDDNEICVEDVNELAQVIEELRQRDGELLKYLAVLAVVEPNTMREALQLSMELHDYERVTEDAAEYGRIALCRYGAGTELFQEINGYMDFERYGRDCMVADGVRQTEFGLIRRCSEPFPEEQQGMQFAGI